MMTTIITDKKKLSAAIADVKTNGRKLDMLIQQVGVSCVYQSIKNGNTTPAMTLIKAMPKGSRVKALIEFMVHFGHMKNPEKANGKADDTKVVFCKAKGLKWDDAMVHDMDDQPWWDFKHNDTTPTAFDVVAGMKKLAKTATKAKSDLDKDDNEIEHKLTDDQYKVVMAAAKALGITLD